jgi:glyceraldehyde 3-phosphate dehydrogenase
MIKVAINGFGRIGRLTLRRLIAMPNVTVLAINDLSSAEALAHLFKYDSSQGAFFGSVHALKDAINIDGKVIPVFSERDPASLPWKSLNIDVVIECTGVFRDEAGLSKHLAAGAKKVILSAPAKGNIKTIVIGVNESTITKNDHLISNASCTTNCLAPVVKILDEEFGLEKGYINTIHAYTADQNLQDAPHEDLRRARAAAVSIVPTTTGAAKAVGLVLPHLKGKLDGMATRVPVITGSMTDLTAILKREATAHEINLAIKSAAQNQMKGIVQYTEDPIVSVDIIGNSYSSIFDAQLTSTQGTFIKVVMWYDNEYGYACRTAELVNHLIF